MNKLLMTIMLLSYLLLSAFVYASPATNTPEEQEKELERKVLVEKLKKQWEEYQKSPKRLFLSGNVNNSDYATYLQDVSKKISKIAKTNMPESIIEQKISGSVLVNIAINSDGSLNKIRIIHPSENKIINESATHFIRLAAPFKPFPKSIIKTKTDIVHITRTLHFNKPDEK